MTTIKEIAQKANVSVGTVDRVIHQRGRVSLETEERVRQIIKDLDYKPNILARSLSRARTINFGALIPKPDQDGYYWELPARGMQKAASELDLFKVQLEYYHYENHNIKDFQRACLEIQADFSKLDGLLIAPVLSQAAESFCHLIPDHLAYVFIDSYLPQSKPISYVGENSYQSGVLAAKLMRLAAGDSGKIAAIQIEPIDYHLNDRVQGFKQAMQALSNIELVFYNAKVKPDVKEFHQLGERILTEHPDIAGIFVPNACTYIFGEFLLQAGKNRHVKLIGYDMVDENIKYLKKEVIDFLISQRSEMQGYESIYSLYRHVVLSQTVEKQVLMPLDIITRENLDSYQRWQNFKIN